MALLTGEGWLFLLRWFHFLAGITWIGILYYFNLVQTPFFAETEPAVRSGAIQKLVPRALWWFRWGAMVTFITGWLIIFHRLGQLGWAGWWNSTYGWAITLGGILGSIMWANVWFVIWPHQQVVIANAVQTARGGQPIPDAAARARRAALASRTNVVFSIPMLFYMGAASHLPTLVRPNSVGKPWVAILAAVIIGLAEINALVGAQGATKKPLDTIQGTLTAGFVLALVFYLMFEIFLRSM
ncbi:MAG TPA: urate hydroxylase PuuD [Methylomirabilota bacterium]|jgi:uncharacterized membrane protein|nr:urate hydroxylase PuuD [Methylomirabilota bacterium]